MRICECEHYLIEHPNDECSLCECKAYRDDSGPIDIDWFAAKVAEVLATLPSIDIVDELLHGDPDALASPVMGESPIRTFMNQLDLLSPGA